MFLSFFLLIHNQILCWNQGPLPGSTFTGDFYAEFLTSSRLVGLCLSAVWGSPPLLSTPTSESCEGTVSHSTKRPIIKFLCSVLAMKFLFPETQTKPPANCSSFQHFSELAFTQTRRSFMIIDIHLLFTNGPALETTSAPNHINCWVVVFCVFVFFFCKLHLP